jgi:membrane fusion protein (multidrug efflux system)
MARRVALTLLALLAVVAVLGGIKGLQISALAAQGKSFVPPPEAVTAAPVKVEHWQPAVTSVGTAAAVQGVTVSAETSGVVRKIAFDSGAVVRRGDLLIEIDQASERAELAAASARAELATANLGRTHHLLEVGANAAADLDSAVAEEKQARAQQATVRAQLAKKTVRAPFAGRLGIRQVNLGEFVADGAPIVSLQSFDPIHVDFSLPQQWLGRLAPGQSVQVSAEGLPGKPLGGTLTTINPDVDPETRNVALQATLDNPEGRLRPGMFVDARVVFPEKQRVLTVPATAVVYAPYGDSVFIVEKARAAKKGLAGYTVRQQFVRLGETRGDIASVASGLSPGQRVVTSGAFKLRPGMPVDVRSELAPEAELSPKPTDS